MRNQARSLGRALLLAWPLLALTTACVDCRPYSPEETEPGPTALLGPGAPVTGDTSGGTVPPAAAAAQDGTDPSHDDDTTGASSQ
jgi:hypothetical protein